MEFIEILKAVLFGLVEGITEWLPISSTGHMILLDEFVKLNSSDDFKKMFLVVIQLGAIMAVVTLYWNKIFPFSFGDKAFIKKETISMWLKVIVACVPAAVIGILWDDKIDEMFYNYLTVALALIVFGVLFIFVENNNKNKKSRITEMSGLTYKTAVIIGLFQLVAAVFPGTSRSGATILGAIMIGVSRTVATEFTFILAIPVMFGASFIKLVKFGFSFTATEVAVLLTGMIVAYIMSVVAIKFLVGYIKKNDFKAFGWYRIVLGAVVLAYFLGRSIL
jgi:undecaprenyl-diphosphatase